LHFLKWQGRRAASSLIAFALLYSALIPFSQSHYRSLIHADRFAELKKIQLALGALGMNFLESLCLNAEDPTPAAPDDGKSPLGKNPCPICKLLHLAIAIPPAGTGGIIVPALAVSEAFPPSVPSIRPRLAAANRPRAPPVFESAIV
jgi:hypothetical protein